MRLFRAALFFCALGVASLLVWYISPHLPDFIERRLTAFNDREVSMLVVNLTKAEYRFSLENTPDDPKNVKTWRALLHADIAFNAAYFLNDMESAGFFKTDNQPSVLPWPTTDEQQDPASYTFLVEIVDDAIDVAYLPATPRTEPANMAFLSFPALVVNGEAAVSKDSELHAARTMLAKDAEGSVYLIITERGDLSLYEAAHWLAEQPENFTLAGNLDGGPSTGLSLENGRFDIEVSSTKVPSVLVGRR